MLKQLKRWKVKRKLRKSAVDFIFGYMCLTENGVKRVNSLIDNLMQYKSVLCERQFTLIETIEIIDDCVVGLNAFLTGTESGFETFEKINVIGKLKTILKIK